MLININMNGAERGNIKHYVMKSIYESQPHSIFFISDYADLGAAETIRKILHEATISGVLEKAGHGIYIKPKISRFGKVPVPLEKIAREIADRDKCEILPTGSTAANLIGLSTQVPMNLSYITTGSTRTIKIGDRKISFRHASRGKIQHCVNVRQSVGESKTSSPSLYRARIAGGTDRSS